MPVGDFPLTTFNNGDGHETRFLFRDSTSGSDRGLRRRVAGRSLRNGHRREHQRTDRFSRTERQHARRPCRVSESVGPRHHGVGRRHRYQHSGQRQPVLALRRAAWTALAPLHRQRHGFRARTGARRGHRGHRPGREHGRIDCRARIRATEFRQGDSTRGTRRVSASHDGCWRARRRGAVGDHHARHQILLPR